MNNQSKNGKFGNKRGNSEIIFKARSVSRGVAVGRAVVLHGDKRQFYKINLEDHQIENEIRRFSASIRLSIRQLRKLTQKNQVAAGDLRTSIFETHIMLLEDFSFLTEIKETILRLKVNAEWAVKLVSDRYITKYKSLTVENLREKYIDLQDVADRILTALGGGKKNIRLENNSIIVAGEVYPSTLTELLESHPKAIITENGGWTSHTFILARELNLPAVTGLKGLLRRVKNGAEVVVDAYAGQVILNPEKETLKNYRVAATQFQTIDYSQAVTADSTLKTLDGHHISILANSDLPDVYQQAKVFGARGIGLYRSEFLFNQNKGFPTENEQIRAYRNIAEMVGDDCIHIRTFDLNFDQLTDNQTEHEKNPALGLRAIRLGISHKTQFQTQIRAILQASSSKKIDILLPMISDVSEIITAKKMLEIEAKQLIKKDIRIGSPQIGAMIEVPSAVWMIEEILDEVDFICLGTNDLVQYLLAVDRDNEAVSGWFNTLHPAVIKAIKKVLQTAEVKNKTAIVCGEMAGSPFYVPVLLGLGAKILSMNVRSMPPIRKIIANIAHEETLEIVKLIDKNRTAKEVEKNVFGFLRDNWSHLYPADSFIFPGSK